MLNYTGNYPVDPEFVALLGFVIRTWIAAVGVQHLSQRVRACKSWFAEFIFIFCGCRL